MDGCGASIVLKNFYEHVTVVPVTYNTEWKLLDEIKPYEGKYDAIICTDFYPAQTINDLRKLATTLVLDHHESVVDKNNDTDIIINTLYSGTKLAYKFIGRFKDIKYLEKLVDIIDDYDMFRLKIPASVYFNNHFWEMGHKWFIRRFITGNTTMYAEEKKYFIDAKKEFDEMYETLEITDLARNGVFFDTDRFHYECIESLKKDGYKWFIIKNKGNLSVRCDDIDLTEIFKKLGRGGGHAHAGGIPLQKSDNVVEWIKKVEYFIDDYYMNMIDD
jgi:nanoRNase/pAp phosphatase (c-di-AMP/oligoRNAs hydrolase)